jgi:hypothetical protein
MRIFSVRTQMRALICHLCSVTPSPQNAMRSAGAEDNRTFLPQPGNVLKPSFNVRYNEHYDVCLLFALPM